MTEVDQIFFLLLAFFSFTFGLDSVSNLGSKITIEVSRKLFGISIGFFVISSVAWAILPSVNFEIQSVASISLITSLFLQALSVRAINHPGCKKQFFTILSVLVVYGVINERYRLEHDFFSQAILITSFCVIAMLWLNYEALHNDRLKSSFYIKSLYILSLIEVVVMLFKIVSAFDQSVSADLINIDSPLKFIGMSSYCSLMLNFYLVDGLLFERTLITSDNSSN